MGLVRSALQHFQQQSSQKGTKRQRSILQYLEEYKTMSVPPEKKKFLRKIV